MFLFDQSILAQLLGIYRSENFVLQPTLRIRTTPSWDAQHIHHQLLMFYEHLSQSATTGRMSAHVFSALCSGPDPSQGLCVESDDAMLAELESSSNFTIN